MIYAHLHNDGREADLLAGRGPLILELWGWPDEADAWVIEAPDTPHNRRHLRDLAIDWCAHGVGPCEATTAGGLPRRGVPTMYTLLLEAACAPTDRAIREAYELLARHQRERAAVREVRHG